MSSTHSVTSTVLANGLTVIIESLPQLQSAAYSLLIPAGSAYDAPGQNGTASALCDWLNRGAGGRDSREVSCEFDRLGVQQNGTVNVSHLKFSGACLASKLASALEIIGDIVQRPHLDEDEFEGAHAGVAHELQGLEDDPRQKVMLELVRRYYPQPWNQPPEGTWEDLERITSEGTRAHFERHVRPDRSLLGIAGQMNPAELLPKIERIFNSWKPGASPVPTSGLRGARQDHLLAESTQTQIGVAYPAVALGHVDYYKAWAAVSVLSGGMSSRLFTEVREKRGLCYSIYAAMSTLKDEGAVLCYAGTTNERAQETLDVMLAELKRLGDGITTEELSRAKALAKSSLVMQQESSSARASSLARNWYHLGRVISVEEIQQAIDGLTPVDVVDYVRRNPPEPFNLLTIGPAPLRSS